VACPRRSASPIPAVTGTGSRRTLGATANIAELSLVRDVLLGMLFVLWTAWWISILVVFAHQTQTAATTPFHDQGAASRGACRRPTRSAATSGMRTLALGGGLIMRLHGFCVRSAEQTLSGDDHAEAREPPFRSSRRQR
jgi:hypothetical protein